jgi:hypothetical protein
MSDKYEIKVFQFTAEDFAKMDEPPTQKERAEEIAHLLKVCATILEKDTDDRYPSVAWRLADAALLMRGLIVDTWGDEQVVAVHYPTGRGAMLPVGSREQ